MWEILLLQVESQDQNFVYVIDSKNIAQMRHVTIGQEADGLRVVKTGLQPDDVVVINGILKVRPNSSVKPENGSMEQFATEDVTTPSTLSKASASLSTRNTNKATQ